MPTITLTLMLQVDDAQKATLEQLATDVRDRATWIIGDEFGNPDRDSFGIDWAGDLAGYEGPYVNHISTDEKVEG